MSTGSRNSLPNWRRKQSESSSASENCAVCQGKTSKLKSYVLRKVGRDPGRCTCSKEAFGDSTPQETNTSAARSFPKPPQARKSIQQVQRRRSLIPAISRHPRELDPLLQFTPHAVTPSFPAQFPIRPSIPSRPRKLHEPHVTSSLSRQLVTPSAATTSLHSQYSLNSATPLIPSTRSNRSSRTLASRIPRAVHMTDSVSTRNSNNFRVQSSRGQTEGRHGGGEQRSNTRIEQEPKAVGGEKWQNRESFRGDGEKASYITRYPYYRALRQDPALPLLPEGSVTILMRKNHPEEKKILGVGAFGKVYLAKVYTSEPRRIDKIAALKIFNIDVTHTTTLSEIIKEASNMNKIGHLKNVSIKVIGLVAVPGAEDRKSLAIVMEYFRGINLLALLRQNTHLPRANVLSVCRQLAKKLLQIHEAGVLLNDLKKDNVMVHVGEETLDVRYIDLGWASDSKGIHMYYDADDSAKRPTYLAPEVRKGQLTSPEADFWSLGKVFMDLGRMYNLRDLEPIWKALMQDNPSVRLPINDVISALEKVPDEEKKEKVTPSTSD